MPVIAYHDNKKYVFWHCPGCGHLHSVPLSPPENPDIWWTFNDDLEKPTITPSILNHAAGPLHQCHCVIIEGMIHFCTDCDHSLANQIVAMTPLAEHLLRE